MVCDLPGNIANLSAKKVGLRRPNRQHRCRHQAANLSAKKVGLRRNKVAIHGVFFLRKPFCKKSWLEAVFLRVEGIRITANLSAKKVGLRRFYFRHIVLRIVVANLSAKKVGLRREAENSAEVAAAGKPFCKKSWLEAGAKAPIAAVIIPQTFLQKKLA